MKRLHYSVKAHMDFDNKIYKDIDNLEHMNEDKIISIIINELIDLGYLNIDWSIKDEEEI